jgi:hypothetical protein
MITMGGCIVWMLLLLYSITQKQGSLWHRRFRNYESAFGPLWDGRWYLNDTHLTRYSIFGIRVDVKMETARLLDIQKYLTCTHLQLDSAVHVELTLPFFCRFFVPDQARLD